MNREDIIRIAHESHLDVYGLGTDYAKFADALERFASLVAKNDTSQERVDETSKNVQKPCGLECDCTDVCKQDDYKALWQQMCERCDELDKKLAQRKPLTDEEIGAILEDVNAYGTRLYTFARAIEAAHGIKGEAK